MILTDFVYSVGIQDEQYYVGLFKYSINVYYQPKYTDYRAYLVQAQRLHLPLRYGGFAFH